MDINQAIALGVGINASLQNAPKSGNILKTLMMRLQNATPAELQAAGIDAAGMGSPRKDISTFLSSVAGVQNIAADGKSFRNAFDVLGDIAKQWSGYNGMQRSAIAEQLAGKNSANGFFSLMENWDAVQKSYQTGQNAQGSANRELANASDSVAFKMKQVQASLEDLSTNFLTSGMLKTGAMSLNSLIQGVNGVVKTVGGPGALGIALGGKDALTSLFTGQGFFSTITHSILGDQNYEKGNGFKNLGKVLNLLGSGAKDLLKGNDLANIGKEVANGAKNVGKDVSTSAMKAIAKEAGNQILRNGGTAEQAGNAAKAAATQAAYNGFGTVNGTVISSKSGKLSTAWASLSGIGKFGVIAGGIVTGITAVVAGFKALDKQIGITSKQSFKNADSAYKQYENASQSLSTTEQKLTDNAEQRKELSKKQNRTLKEQAKLEDLNAENTELTTKKQTQEVAKRLKGQQAAEKASHAMDVEFKGNETTVTNLQDWAKSISDFQKRGTDIQLPDNLNSFQTTLSQYAAAGELAKNGTKAQQAEAKGQIKNLSKSVNKGINDSLKALKIFRGVGYDNLTAGQKKAYNVAESNLNAGYYAQYAAAGEPEKWAQQRMGTLWDDYITKNGKAINREMQAFDKNFNIGDYIDGAWAEGLAKIADLTGSGKVSIKNLSGSMKDFAKQFEDAGLSKYINNINSQAREAQQSASDLANTVRNGKQVAASNTDTVMTEAKRRAEIKKNVDAAESMASSASGMSYEQATLMSTQGFGSALERTGSGIRLNQQKYNLLQQTQLQTELADKTDDLNRAYDDYYDNLNAINKLQHEIASSGGKATDDQAQRLQTLNQSHRILAQNIENEKNALASIGGENSAVNRFLNAGSGPSDVQDNVAKGLSQVQQDIKKGRVSSDRVRKMVNMANFEDTSGWSNKQVGEKSKSSLKHIAQYGSFDKQGNFTFDQGKLKSAMQGYQDFIRKNGNPTFTMFDEAGKKINATKEAIQGLAKYLNLDQSVVQQAIDSQSDYGYDVQTAEASAKTIQQRIHDSKEETKALNENANARKNYLKDQSLMNDENLNNKYQAGRAANATNNKAVQQGVRNDLNSEIDRINQARVQAAAKGDGEATEKLNDALAQRLMLRENLDSGAKNKLMNLDPEHASKNMRGFVDAVQEAQKAQNELSVANQLQAQGIYADTDAAKGKVTNTVNDLVAATQTTLQSGDKNALASLAKVGLNQNSSAAQISAALMNGNGTLNSDNLNKIAGAIQIKIEKEENKDNKSGSDNNKGKGNDNSDKNKGSGGSNKGKDKDEQSESESGSKSKGKNKNKNKGKSETETREEERENWAKATLGQDNGESEASQAEQNADNAEKSRNKNRTNNANKRKNRATQGEQSDTSSSAAVQTAEKSADDAETKRKQSKKQQADKSKQRSTALSLPGFFTSLWDSLGSIFGPQTVSGAELSPAMRSQIQQSQRNKKPTTPQQPVSESAPGGRPTQQTLDYDQRWKQLHRSDQNTTRPGNIPGTNVSYPQVSAAEKAADQAENQRNQRKIQNANKRANNARQATTVDATSSAAVETATKQANTAETQHRTSKKQQADRETQLWRSQSRTTLSGNIPGTNIREPAHPNVNQNAEQRQRNLEYSQSRTTKSGNIPGTNIKEPEQTVKVKTEADTSGLQKGIEGATKGKTAKVNTQADTSKLQSGIDSATKGKTAKVDTEADTSKLNASIDSATKGKQVSVDIVGKFKAFAQTATGLPQQTPTSGRYAFANGGQTTPRVTTPTVVQKSTSTKTTSGTAELTPKIKGKVKATGTAELTPKVKGKVKATGTATLTPKVKGKVKASGTANLTPKVKGKVTATGKATLTPTIKGKAKTLTGTANYKGKFPKSAPAVHGTANYKGNFPKSAPTISGSVNYKGNFPRSAPALSSTITYTIKTVGSVPGHSGWQGTAHSSGTASRIVGHSFATGSATDDKDETGSAYAGGRYTVGRNETALVNELGPELIVRGNQFFIANGGKPGFTDLRSQDIVFNKKQTSDLLTKGYTNTYAHAQGTVSGLAFAKGSTKKSSDSDDDSSSSSKKKSSSSDDKQKVDWIDILTTRTQRVSTTFENAGKRLLAATNNFRLAITHYDISIQSQRRLIDQYTKATARYQRQADKVGLSADLVEKVKNGTIDIGEYDDDTQKKISEYQQWYEKTLSCADAIEQARSQVHELNQEKLDAVTSSFENLRNVVTSTRTLIEDQGALFEAFNGYGDNINVERQKDYLEKEMTNYRQEAAELQKTLDSLTDENGKPLDGMDQEVLATKAQITDCNAKIIETATSIKKLNDTRLDNITNQFKTLSDLLDSITNKFNSYETLEKTMNGYVSSSTIDKQNDALNKSYDNIVNQQAEINLENDRQQRELSQQDYDALKSQVDVKKKELAEVTKQRNKVQAQINERDKKAQAAQKTTAASGNSYTTRANYNMRETANGKRITTIPKGTTVQGTGKTSGDWTQVTYNGKTGYVLNRGLTKVAATPTTKATATKAKPATTVKESAASAAVVKQSALNKVTESINEAVSVGAKQGAKAAATAAKPATTAPAANSYQLTATYNMRKTAGGKKVGSIPKGTTVTATGNKSGNWTEVTYNGKTGYVYNKGLKQITVGQQANTDGIKKTEKNQDALGQQLTEWNKQVVAKQTEVAQAQEEVSNFKVGFDVNGPDAKVKLANQAKTSVNTAATNLIENRNSFYENEGKRISSIMDQYNQDSAINNAQISFLDKISSYITSNGGSISNYLPAYQSLYAQSNKLAQASIQNTMAEVQRQAAAGTLTKTAQIQAAQNILTWQGSIADAQISMADKTKSADEEAEEHLSKVEQHYSALISLVDSYLSYLQAENELINKQTGYDDRQSLVSQIAEQEKKQKELNIAIAAEEAEMKNLKEGSTDWLNAAANVQNYKTQIVQSKSAIEDLKKSIRTLDWRHFDVGVAKNKHLMNEVDSTISLMSTLNNFEYQSPNITANGMTNLNLNAQGLVDARKLIDDYTQAINKLNSEYASGAINEKTYTEEMQDNTEKRYDAIASANKYRQAIINEVKDGIEQETSAMQELINKRTDALSRLKTAHDYEQQIAKSNKNISRIQAQINMLNGDDSQKANQRRRTLQNQLKDAQDDLQDQRDQQRYNTVTQAYNDELTAFQDMQKKKEYALNDSVEAQNKVIEDALKASTAQYTTTTQTLSNLFATFGIDASESLTSPWQNAQTAAETFKDAAQLDGVVRDIDLFPQETAEALTNPWEGGIAAAEKFQDQVSSTVAACSAQLQQLNDETTQLINKIMALATIDPEDVINKAENDANKKAGATVNRYYNPKTGQHLDTTSEKEKANLENSGWSRDSVSWKETTDKNAVPVYRVRNPNNGDYLYTTSVGEKNSIVSKGWKDEGVSQYANSGNSGKPIYRLYNQKTGMHFFTSSVGEKNTREKQGWKSEGIAYYSGYAGGTYKASKGTHLTDEKGLGSEVIITKNGALRQLDSGDRVFNDEQVKALWAMSKVPAAKFTPVYSSIPEATGKPITVTNNYGSLLTVNGNVDQETLPSLEEILKKASEQTRKDMVDSFRKYGINR